MQALACGVCEVHLDRAGRVVRGAEDDPAPVRRPVGVIGAVHAGRRYTLQVAAVGRVRGPDLGPTAAAEEVAFEDEPRPVRRPLWLVILGLLEPDRMRHLMEAEDYQDRKSTR